MQRLRTYLIALAALLAAPSLARAQSAPYDTVQIIDNALSAAALNSTQTIIVDLQAPARPSSKSAYAKARLAIKTTYGAASAIVVTFYCAPDGTNYAQWATRATSATAGVFTVTPSSDSIPTGGGAITAMPEYDIRGCRKAKWTFGGTGANSSDTATVDVSLIAGD